MKTSFTNIIINLFTLVTELWWFDACKRKFIWNIIMRNICFSEVPCADRRSWRFCPHLLLDMGSGCIKQWDHCWCSLLFFEKGIKQSTNFHHQTIDSPSDGPGCPLDAWLFCNKHFVWLSWCPWRSLSNQCLSTSTTVICHTKNKTFSGTYIKIK